MQPSLLTPEEKALEEKALFLEILKNPKVGDAFQRMRMVGVKVTQVIPDGLIEVYEYTMGDNQYITFKNLEDFRDFYGTPQDIRNVYREKPNKVSEGHFPEEIREVMTHRLLKGASLEEQREQTLRIRDGI